MEQASQLVPPPVSRWRTKIEIYVPPIEDVDAEQAFEVTQNLCFAGRFQEALPFAEAALEEMKASHGSSHTKLCQYLVLLAQVHLALGADHLESAAVAVHRALQIFAAKPPSEKVSGAHPKTKLHWN
jgi:hypothetical protein